MNRGITYHGQGPRSSLFSGALPRRVPPASASGPGPAWAATVMAIHEAAVQAAWRPAEACLPVAVYLRGAAWRPEEA